MVAQRLERRSVAACINSLHALVRINAVLAQAKRRKQVPGRGGRIGVGERTALDFRQRLDARTWPRDDGSVIGGRFALLACERGDGLRMRDLMGKPITDPSELAQLN